MKRKAGRPLKRGNMKRRRTVTVPKKRQPRYNVSANVSGLVKKYNDVYGKGQAIVSPTDSAGGEIDVYTNVGAETQPNHLSCVYQGEGEEYRDGNDVRLISLQIKGTVSCAPQVDQTAIDGGCKVFIALVIDTQTNGTRINSEDVYTNLSALAINAASPLRKMSMSKRYKVIKTWEMDFDKPQVAYDGTNLEQGGLIKSFDCYIPMDITQQYTATNGLISAVSDNSIQMIAYTSNTGLAPTIQFNGRVRFVSL